MDFSKERTDVNSENMWEGWDPIDIFSCCPFGLPTLPFYDPQNPNTSIYIYAPAYNVMQIQDRLVSESSITGINVSYNILLNYCCNVYHGPRLIIK